MRLSEESYVAWCLLAYPVEVLAEVGAGTAVEAAVPGHIHPPAAHNHTVAAEVASVDSHWSIVVVEEHRSHHHTVAAETVFDMDCRS